MVLVNARIIVGTGKVIEGGSIVVEKGKIAAVQAGRAAPRRGSITLDATGMTLIAGYIDCHRHLIDAGYPAAPAAVDKFMTEKAADRMRDLLASGVTTVESGLDDNVAILKLKQMVDSGQIVGPRIITSASVPTAILPSEAAVRSAIDAAHASGADTIAEVPYPWIRSRTVDTQWPFNPTEQETRNLAAGLDEARKLSMPFQVHAVSPPAQVAAVRLGARRLVHSSHYEFMTDAQAREIAATGAIVASSTGVGVPVFGVFNADGKPTYRDGKPWPKGNPAGEDRGQAAGKFPVNSRTLYDNGVTFAYSSDTNFDGSASLSHELRVLSLMFSPIDLVQIMGPNSAKFVEHGDDLGALEVGKVADILVLVGNPLDGYWNFLKPVAVIKGGRIAIDKRSQLKTVGAL